MARSRNKRKRPMDAVVKIEPAPARGDFAFFRGRHQRVPVIDTMFRRGQLNEGEYRALAFYRDQACLADRTPVRSCLNDNQGSGSDIYISAAITSAILTTARIEKDLGQLRPIARAVAIDDKSLTEWCVEQFGGRERYNDKGQFIAIVPVGEKKAEQMALMELRMAARRVVA